MVRLKSERKHGMNKTFNFIALFLTLALLIPCQLQTAAAEPIYTDISGHWAEAAIMRWSELGIIKGDAGKFFPNNTITRAELCTILNRLLIFPGPAPNPFSDVADDAWYCADASALAHQGILYENSGDFKPGESITRQEAIYIIARAFSLYTDSSLSYRFKDSDQTAEWALPYISGMRRLGFIEGYPDRTFGPQSPFTRAEIITLLGRMIDAIITEPGVYDTPVGEKVLVNARDVSFSNQDFKYLYVSPGAENGKVTIYVAGTKLFHVFQYGSSQSNVELLKDGMMFPDGSYSRTTPINPLAFFAGGDGSIESPYLIGTQSQLEQLHFFVGILYRDKHFRLINDIRLTGTWTPIALNPIEALMSVKDEYFFFGTLDGGGHTISGLNINVNAEEGANAGLISQLAGTVRNLNIQGKVKMTIPDSIFLENADVNPALSNDEDMLNDSEGSRFPGSEVNRTQISKDTAFAIGVGGIAGMIDGISRTPNSGGNRIQSVIENCSADVEVTVIGGAYSNAGGIAGRVLPHGELKNCTSTGAVTARSSPVLYADSYGAMAGGLAGQIQGTVESCSSSADVSSYGGDHSSAGGLAGHIIGYTNVVGTRVFPAIVKNSYATGNVHAQGGYFQNNAGGFSGQIQYAEIDSCFATSDVTVGNFDFVINVAGGFASGLYLDGNVKNCYATGSVIEYGTWEWMIGGFTGRLESSVLNCYSTGESIAINSKNSQNPTYVSNIAVGSRRGAGGTINMLADLSPNGKLSIIDEPLDKAPVIKGITAAQAGLESTYVNCGWDFDTVWALYNTEGYSLPILRNCDKAFQLALTMPKHLR